MHFSYPTTGFKANYDLPNRSFASIQVEIGVGCEGCHGPGADFQKMSIMKDRDAAVANGLVIPSQATCDGCHTGDDHASKKVLADELNNKEAIHEFKNSPGE